MTIEIRQLVIRANAEARAESSGADEGKANRPMAAESGPELTGGELVAACVRQVLRELRKSRDR